MRFRNGRVDPGPVWLGEKSHFKHACRRDTLVGLGGRYAGRLDSPLGGMDEAECVPPVSVHDGELPAA